MFDVAMVLTVEERVELSALVHGRDVPAIVATRTQIVLWWTEGRRKKDIAMLAGVTRPTVDFWISRYAQEGTGGLLDRSRAAPREQVPARIRGRILGADPKQSAGGVGPVTLVQPTDGDVHRVHGRCAGVAQLCGGAVAGQRTDTTATGNLQPGSAVRGQGRRHRRPVPGPTRGAVVLSVDEKTQLQALDRTQPLLPISVGAAEKRTHDYVRHGTTNLFAALNVTSGDVYGECHPTRAGASFLAFLKHAVAPHARMSMSCWPICRRTPHPMSRPGGGQPAGSLPLHPGRRTPDQSDRGLVQHPDSPVHPPRHLHLGAGPRYADPRL